MPKINKIVKLRNYYKPFATNNYHGYSLSLLQKIAVACGADLKIGFVFKRGGEPRI